MLYDPKWEQQTKADPFLLATLVAWLENRAPAQAYDYSDPRNCLLCQYFTDHGFQDVLLNRMGMYYRGSPGPLTKYPEIFCDISNAQPMTFGAALERARIALRSRTTPR